MRKLCPNYDKEDGLETVLEVPFPDEMFDSIESNGDQQYVDNKCSYLSAISNNECMALIKLIGSPLIPLQVQSDNPLIRPIKNCSIEATTAKYVQQFVAATGGLAALNSVTSMYALGQVKMAASEMHQGDDDSVHTQDQGEVGGFVLWQKNPDMWCLELVVSDFKVSAGSNGKLAWNQSSSSQPFHANKGPPRPLRRFFQGLDPRYVANLFQEAICVRMAETLREWKSKAESFKVSTCGLECVHASKSWDSMPLDFGYRLSNCLEQFTCDDPGNSDAAITKIAKMSLHHFNLQTPALPLQPWK